MSAARRAWLPALVITASFCSAPDAAAQNPSTAGTPEFYATFSAIGVRLPYTGDANGNASAHLEWRPQGDSVWTRGTHMTRITNQRWAASLFWLKADTPYEVRAVIEDPDGGSSAAGTARTRREPSRTPTGRAWWVATNGSDAAPGTIVAPLATLQAAADSAQPGDAIRVRPGTYYQALDAVRSGTPGSLIHLVADGPGVILDGCDPAWLNRSDWRSDGGGVYSLPFAGNARLVCVDSLQRLYHHASLAALQSNAGGVAQGFAVESGRVWVKLENGGSPVGHAFHLARYDIGVQLDVNYWRVSGFEIRHFGTQFGTDQVSAGIGLAGAIGCVVSDNHVHTTGGRSIFLHALAADNLIEHNLCRDPRLYLWPWSAVKGTDAELTAISNRAGRGNVIRFNTVRGTFNGIDAREGDADENITADTDIHDNLIFQIADDGIETDVISAINLRVWRNRIDSCYVGVSIAPITQGPEYVLYNTIVRYTRSGFKFSLWSTGHAWIYHNTVATSVFNKAAVHPSGVYSNIHFRNNVLVGSDRVCVSDDAGESDVGNDYDADLVYSNYTMVFRWKNINYSSIASLRSATGFEMNGRQGNPLFVSPATGDYTLQPGSPAIDGGLRFPGINDLFAGAAPDMGAQEVGLTVDVPRGRAAAGLRLGPAAPNPSREGTTVSFTLPRAGRVTLAVHDASGRRVRVLDDRPFPAGDHASRWDGRDERGHPARSGIYFVRLATSEGALTTKLVKLR